MRIERCRPGWAALAPLLAAAVLDPGGSASPAPDVDGTPGGTAPAREWQEPPKPPNVLLVVIDDVGMDMIGGTYQEVSDAPATPYLDQVATSGVFFRNAWSNPQCSPTRATCLTGQYSFRSGIGTWISSASGWGLPADGTTLPDRLREAGYRSGAFGKWHLAVDAEHGPGQGLLHPLHCGFDVFDGVMRNPSSGPMCEASGCAPGCQAPYDYYNWARNTNGFEDCSGAYLTTATTDFAIDFAHSGPEPWFAYVAYNAIHSPVHDPTGTLPPDATDREQAKAMMEGVDAELGRLLRAVGYPDPNLWVIVVSDNGTEDHAAFGDLLEDGCFGGTTSKGTLHEGGVNVPLAVDGPGVRTGMSEALVATVDLYATVCELAGLASEAEDSRSFASVLAGAGASAREFLYAERFEPNGLPLAVTEYRQAVRGGRYKLIRWTNSSGVSDELFDLLTDPCELTSLLPAAPGSPEEGALLELEAQLAALPVAASLDGGAGPAFAGGAR